MPSQGWPNQRWWMVFVPVWFLTAFAVVAVSRWFGDYWPMAVVVPWTVFAVWWSGKWG